MSKPLWWLLSVCVATTAYADDKKAASKKPKAKLLVGAELNPPRVIDYSTMYLKLDSRGSGYHFYARQFPYGYDWKETDKYRMEWKQGGKLLAERECFWDADEWMECNYSDTPIKATGAIEASLIMTDGADGTEYLLHTYKVKVAKYPNFGDPVWQIVPDDLLATAYAAGMQDGAKRGVAGGVFFRFWLAKDLKADMKASCTVDGKTKLPDFPVARQDDNEVAADTHSKKGDAKKYVWRQLNSPSGITPGLPPKDFKPDPEKIQYLGEHPGAWECDVGIDGKAQQIRKLIFKVNDKGYIEPDPAQAGTPTPPGNVPIEIRFGKDVFDDRVRPDAMKKSRGYGLPWPKAPTKPFPKASGFPDPK